MLWHVVGHSFSLLGSILLGDFGYFFSIYFY